jgi:hypothetical protein
MKLYMVTDGNYSDYHVCGVYSTPEKAERARQLYAADGIEEMDLDAMPDAPDGMARWIVMMNRDGHSSSVRHVDASPEWLFEDQFYRSESTEASEWGFTMWARDEEHAVKIANERRIQLLANNQWEPTE